VKLYLRCDVQEAERSRNENVRRSEFTIAKTDSMYDCATP
jgi:hypothetical protein